MLVGAGRSGDHRPRLRRRVGARRACRRSIAPSCSRRSPRSSGPNGPSRPRHACSSRATLAAAVPYLQPLALSAATRKQASKSLLSELRDAVATATGEEPAPLEPLDPRAAPHAVHDRRARRRVLRAAAPARQRRRQLPRVAARELGLAGRVRRDVAAHLRRAPRSAWPAACAEHLPVRAERRGADGVVVRQPGDAGERRRHGAQRALPAEGGRPTGRSGDRRRPQRRSPAPSCTSCCSSCSSPGPAQRRHRFSIPGGSKLLVVIAGGARGRRRRSSRPAAGAASCAPTCSASSSSRGPSIDVLARSPVKLAALFGGSVGVTLAYIAALRGRGGRVRRRRSRSPRSARSTSVRRSSRPPHRRPAASARSRRRSSPASPAWAWSRVPRSPPC